MRRIERNISLVKWIYITQGLVFVAPVLVLYFGSRGLELSQILMLQFVFSASSFALEFPSGYISDKLGRKRTLVVAYSSLVLAVYLFLNGVSFNTFAIAEFAFASGYSLISGTVDSLLYETLKVLGKENEYRKVYGDLNHKQLLSVAFAGIVGGLMAKYIGLSATVVVTLIAFTVTLVLSLFLEEPKGINPRGLREDIKDFKLVLSNKELISITVFVALVFAFNQVIFWYYQPYFKAIDVNLAYFGLLFASFQIVASIGSKYANAVMQKFTIEQIFIIVSIATLLSFVGMGWFFSYAGLLFIYFQQLVRGGFRILSSEYAHRHASDELRATTISFMTLAKKLLFAGNLYFFVQISKGVGLEQVFFIMASVLAGLLLLFFVIKRLF